MLIHIGFHKTATSWLQRKCFSDHPELYVLGDYRQPMHDPLLQSLVSVSDRTFDVGRTQSLVAERAADAPKGAVMVLSAERLSGHAASGGYDQFSIATRLHETFPTAKVLMVVRQQTTLLPSVYRQLVREGYRGSFADLLAGQHWKATGFQPDMYYFDAVVQRYDELFGAQQVLVLRFEDFVADRQSFVDNVTDFVGVAASVQPPSSIVNPTAPEGEVVALRRLNSLRASELNPRPFVGFNARYVRRAAALAGRLLPQAEVVTAEQVAWIEDHYHASNTRLQQLLSARRSEEI